MSRQALVDRSPGVYYFCFQFFAHEVHFSKDLYNIKNPAVAIRFLDFPTLLIRATLSPNGTIVLGSGKKTSFSMHSEDLYACLDSKPAFVMFVDADPVNTSIKASTTISLNIFAQNRVFLNNEDPSTNLKRSSITLFDNLKNPIGKLDATICISLLDPLNVEVLKERERGKGTAIKGARITHKTFESEVEEDHKYDVKVTKPQSPPKKGKILSTREQDIKVDSRQGMEKNPFEMENKVGIIEVEEETVGEETKDRQHRSRSKDRKPKQNQLGIRNKADDMEQIDNNEILDIKKLFMQHK